jgi:hypothetical protein
MLSRRHPPPTPMTFSLAETAALTATISAIAQRSAPAA